MTCPGAGWVQGGCCCAYSHCTSGFGCCWDTPSSLWGRPSRSSFLEAHFPLGFGLPCVCFPERPCLLQPSPVYFTVVITGMREPVVRGGKGRAFPDAPVNPQGPWAWWLWALCLGAFPWHSRGMFAPPQGRRILFLFSSLSCNEFPPLFQPLTHPLR